MIKNLDILNAIQKKNVFKAISGINNFDINSVSQLVKASELAGATYVDICAQPEIINQMKLKYSIPICVSITSLKDLNKAVNAGADMIELGNFDTLYDKGFYMGSKEIYNIALRIRQKYPEIPLCVTIPYTLNLEEQVNLAKDLENIDIDMLQTEGKQAPKYEKKLVYNISRALSTLTSTYILSKAVNIPILTASNLSEITCSMAIHYGACGVGVGRSIMKENEINIMIDKIKSLKNSLIIDSINIDKLACMNNMLNSEHICIY